MKSKWLMMTMIILLALMTATSGVMAVNHLQLAPLPFVSLSSPTGGESMQVGSTHNITWTKSAGGGSTQLYYSTNAGANWTFITFAQGNSYSWTVPNQTTNQARIRVRWSPDGNNWYTSSSNNFTIYQVLGPIDLGIQGVPPAPADLSANAVSSSSINLSWTDNANNETGYKVERRITMQAGGFVEVAVLDPNTTAYADTGLSAMTDYTYRVRAFNAMGNSAYSNEASATTLQLGLAPPPAGAPSAPSDLKVEAVAGPAFSLSWSDNSDNELAFHIERKINEGNFEEIGEVGANTVVYVDEDVTSDVLHVYRVRARNANGYSAYSNERSGIMFEVADPEEPEEPVEPEEPDEPDQPQVPLPEDGIMIRFFINQSDYFVNNTLHSMDTIPIISGGRTLLPIRYVAEALGASVGWNGAEQKVTIQFEDTTIELWINQKDARVNGMLRQIDPNNDQVTPVIIPPGRTMLPLRFVAENLGSSVDWEPIGQEVTIIYPAP